MDIEFHYYMTHIIALRAGYNPEEAFTIAYASQYTDDNDKLYSIEGDSGAYEYLISQTLDILKPQEQRLSIYPVFHFCPATIQEIFEAAPLRRDGAYHRLDTIPDNLNARLIFTDAMEARNLYRIGIGAHMYADTFCHRDFVGWKDAFNWTRLDGFFEGIWSAIGPEIGHALAGHNPDIPALVWDDVRLISKYKEKRNKAQILAAAGKVFDFFCLNTNLDNATLRRKQLINDLDSAIGDETENDSDALKEQRMENYKTLLGSDHIAYRKAHWFNDAIEWRPDTTSGSPDMMQIFFQKDKFRSSEWYSFQEAVKAHRTHAFKILNETFETMEINIDGIDLSANTGG
jgi:hypothetical protein